MSLCTKFYNLLQTTTTPRSPNYRVAQPHKSPGWLYGCTTQTYVQITRMAIRLYYSDIRTNHQDGYTVVLLVQITRRTYKSPGWLYGCTTQTYVQITRMVIRLYYSDIRTNHQDGYTVILLRHTYKSPGWLYGYTTQDIRTNHQDGYTVVLLRHTYKSDKDCSDQQPELIAFRTS